MDTIFKGTIEKRILDQVKKLIKTAELEYKAFVKEHDTQIDAQIDALEVKRVEGKKEKEDALVDVLLGKFI